MGAAVFAVVFGGAVIGGLGFVLTFFVWFTAQTALMRYLRASNSLNADDISLYVKDMALISVIFILASVGYRYVALASRIGSQAFAVLFGGAIVIALFSAAVVAWEYEANSGKRGDEEAARKLQRFGRGTTADRQEALLRVKHAIMDHIRVRDALALFVLVVAPFVVTVLALLISSQLHFGSAS